MAQCRAFHVEGEGTVHSEQRWVVRHGFSSEEPCDPNGPLLTVWTRVSQKLRFKPSSSGTNGKNRFYSHDSTHVTRRKASGQPSTILGPDAHWASNRNRMDIRMTFPVEKMGHGKMEPSQL